MTPLETTAVAGLFALLFCMLAPEARAQAIDAAPLSSAELAEVRGGFLLPTGIEANFGAVARTFADGALVLETHFTWSPDGILREDVLASAQLVSTDELVGGFVLQDASGATTFAHQVDDMGVRNILLNQANGRDIRIDTQLTVTLPSFTLTQRGITDALAVLHLFDDMQPMGP